MHLSAQDDGCSGKACGSAAVHIVYRLILLPYKWCVTTHGLLARQSTSTGDLVTPLKNNLIQPEQLGVAYFGLLGVLSTPQENLAGVLHIFVKAVVASDHGYQLRGFSFYDASSDLQLWADLKLGTPSQLTTWVPRLTVSCTVPGAPNITLTAHPAISDGRPFTFEGHLPTIDSQHTYHLHVDHWPRHVPLTRPLRMSRPPAGPSTAPQVFTVIGQLYGLPSKVWQCVLETLLQTLIKGETSILTHCSVGCPLAGDARRLPHAPRL